MSYCRFENTTRDIEDCLNAIEYGEVSADELSQYEANALRDFVSLAKEIVSFEDQINDILTCLLYTSPSPRDLSTSRMPSSA